MAEIRMIGLSDYLRAEAARCYALGAADCMTLVAGWVALHRDVDPMAALRGYSSEPEANAIVAGWGGIARVMGRALRAAGLRLTRQPWPGDVALIALQDGRAVGAIRSPRGWVMRLDTGIAMLPSVSVRVVAAWSV